MNKKQQFGDVTACNWKYASPIWPKSHTNMWPYTRTIMLD